MRSRRWTGRATRADAPARSRQCCREARGCALRAGRLGFSVADAAFPHQVHRRDRELWQDHGQGLPGGDAGPAGANREDGRESQWGHRDFAGDSADQAVAPVCGHGDWNRPQGFPDPRFASHAPRCGADPESGAHAHQDVQDAGGHRRRKGGASQIPEAGGDGGAERRRSESRGHGRGAGSQGRPIRLLDGLRCLGPRRRFPLARPLDVHRRPRWAKRPR